jgi:hypothetical protein
VSVRIAGAVIGIAGALLLASVRPTSFRGDSVSTLSSFVAVTVLMVVGLILVLEQKYRAGQHRSTWAAIAAALFAAGGSAWLVDALALHDWRAPYETATVVVGGPDRLTDLGRECLKSVGSDAKDLLFCGAGVPGDVWDADHVRYRWLLMQALYVTYGLSIPAALLSLAVVLLRSRAEASAAAGEVARAVPVRILFLAANPLDTSHVDLEEELRGIEHELRAVKFRDAFALTARHAIRADDLIREVREQAPRIIHFSGHGSEEGILLRSDHDASQAVQGRDLAQFLKDRGVKLVVLNACYSTYQASEIASAVEAVVGTTDAVDDEAARRFSVAFYRALGEGLSVREAFRDGRDAVTLHGLDDVFRCEGNLDLVFVEAGATAAAAGATAPSPKTDLAGDSTR